MTRNHCAMSESCADKPADRGMMKAKRPPVSPTRYSYYAMKSRVTNPNRNTAKHYIGRGIDMDPRWQIFSNFFSDMGERPEGMTLDRIDNDKGYWPDNCRWATPEQQLRNRSNNVNIVVDGRSMILSDALRFVGRPQASYWKYFQKPENDTPQKAFDDMVRTHANIKRATDTHCANGHQWTVDNLRYHGAKRYCLTCHSVLAKERRRKRALSRSGLDHRAEDRLIGALITDECPCIACRSDCAGIVPCMEATDGHD